MLDSKEIRLFILRNGYLLIVAAWLFTFAFLFNNYWSYYSSPHGVQRSLESDIRSREQAFNDLAEDTALVRKLFSGMYSEGQLKDIYRQDYFLFACDTMENGHKMVFWSTNTVQPPLHEGLRPGTTFRKLANGYYVVVIRTYPSGRYLQGLIPVKQEYAISNDYLPGSFYGRPAIGREYTINSRPPGLPVLNTDNTILFYLHYDPAKSEASPSLMSVLLLTLGCICVLIFINLFATLIAKKMSPLKGFIFLLVIVLTFRVLSYVYAFPDRPQQPQPLSAHHLCKR